MGNPIEDGINTWLKGKRGKVKGISSRKEKKKGNKFNKLQVSTRLTPVTTLS
jgi:hypothetical protein